MGYRKALTIFLVLTFSFIFSPLAAASETGRPSFLEMRQFYYEKLGKPDHIVVEFCLLHPGKWVKRTYIWEDRFAVAFLWRPKIGWQILNMWNLKPRSA